MFCPSCGNQIADGSAFCPACGKATNAAVQVVPVQYGYVKPKVPGRGLGIAGMILGILGLVFCVVTLVFVLDFVENSSASKLYSYLSYRGHRESYFSYCYHHDVVPLITLLSSFGASFILSLLSLSMACAGRRKGAKNSVSTSGVVMGTIGLTILLGILILFIANI